MKIALVNDQHFGVRNDSDIFSKYQEAFYRDTFFPYIDKHDITTVIDLGDTFDKRKEVNFKTLSNARRFWFDELEKRKIDVHIIVGNHTSYYKNTNELTILHTIADIYPNVTIYTDPRELTLGNNKFLLLPWINSSNYDTSLKAIEETSAPCCLAHLELGGFAYQLGGMSSHGMSAKIFDNFQMVLSGHYHSKSDNGRIFYLGTQYDLTWADFGEKKYFHILDTDTLELTPIQNPGRMFVKMEYDDSISGLAKDIKKDNFERITGKIVKVVVHQKSNAILFDTFIDKLTAALPADLSIVDETHNFQYNNNENLLVNDTMTIVKQTIDEIPTELDKDRLFTLIHDLHVEALQE